ncbi:MAG: LysR family transcriptional regulator [Coriobacteriales bacterium]|nr:LysR family transcriptional regulator [Coriobacteriales bacterium]
MNFTELGSVMAVYYYHSFSEASNQTAFSVSAISKHVSHVEDELGIKLFERKTKATDMALTEDGQSVLPLLSQIMNDYQTLLKQVERCKGARDSSISIGYLPLIGSIGESDIITRFYESSPGANVIPVIMSGRDLVKLVDAGKIDGAFIMLIGSFEEYKNDWEALSDSRLRFMPTLHSTGIHLAISDRHPLADRISIDLSELKDETFIFASSQDPRTHLAEASRVSYVRNLVGLDADSFKAAYMDFLQRDVVMNLVASGMGVLPCSCYNGRQFPGVRFLPVEGWHQEVTGVFVYQVNNVSPLLSDFRMCVDEYAREHRVSG